MIKKFFTKKITRGRLKDFIAPYATSGKVLDLGCSAAPYANFFPNRLGMDIREGPGVDVVGDAHEMPFGDAEFDAILCTEVLEHLHTPEKAISEMNRVLKPGGTLLLSTRFIFPIHDAPGDYYRYTKYGLKHLFRNWEMVRLEEEAGTKDSLAVLLQRVVYQSDLKGGKLTKLFLLLCAQLIQKFPNLIRGEYADIKKSGRESNIMASGYYLICRKK